MPNVVVYLHNGDVQITEKSKNYLQTATTDSKGKYSFKNVQLGHYQVVAVYSENQSKFSVEPNAIKTTIDGKSLTLEPF